MFYQNYLAMNNTADVTGGKPIAIFYDINGRKIEVLFFYFVPDTTRDYYYTYYIYIIHALSPKGLQRYQEY
jgi:hypothetical protein